MNISKLTIGQQKALFESLRDQKSTKTPAESRIYNQLREIFADQVDGWFILDGYAKQIHFDSFGDGWRNKWLKIYENDKGSFVDAAYFGGRHYIVTDTNASQTDREFVKRINNQLHANRESKF